MNISIIIFFLITWGLGFSITKFVRKSNNSLERNLMNIGIGIGVFVLLGTILNLFHIPIDYKIFLLFALVIPLYSLFNIIKNKQLAFPKLRLTKSSLAIFFVLLIFAATFFMYHKGAFAYPYLENDDPWSHAVGAKYVALEKTLNQPESDDRKLLFYLDPYPPGYDLLLGVMHQTNDSIYWTLKFFNALIISISVVFFYFFAKEFTSDRNKALFSTFILAAIPCFFTHFIWAHSLVIMLFFPALYCLEMIKYDKKWMYVAILVISAIPLTQPSQAIKLFFLIAVYSSIKILVEKDNIKQLIIAPVGGYFLSIIWWYNKWKLINVKYDVVKSDVVKTSTLDIFPKILEVIKKRFSPSSGSATRAYTFNDFFVAKHQGLINNSIGVGIIISILLVTSLIYLIFKYKSLLKKENSWILISLVWLIFTFLLVNSVTFNLPIGFYAFRSWLLLAIPIALLAPLSLNPIFKLLKKNSLLKIIVLFLIIFGIIFTSFNQKYSVNTAQWPPGVAWTSNEEVQAYLWLNTLPPDTKVFDYSGVNRVIGFDKYQCMWCKDELDFRENILDKNATEVHRFLKSRRYEYLLMSGMAAKYLKTDKNISTSDLLNQKVAEVISSNLFQPVHQTNGAIILKLK